MNLSFFLARGMMRSGSASRASRLATLLTTIGVALGLAVMVVSLAVLLGYKQTLRNRITGATAALTVEPLATANDMATVTSINFDDRARRAVLAMPAVTAADRYAEATGVLKTNDDFHGLLLKGVEGDYHFDFLKSCLVAGRLPQKGEAGKNEILLSQRMARALSLECGSSVMAYFFNNGLRARRFKVVGLYASGFRALDEQMAVGSFATVATLTGLGKDRVGGVEVRLRPEADAEAAAISVSRYLNTRKGAEGVSVRTVDERYPGLFAWLSLLDTNVAVIFVLMLAVAGFSMVSGLLILVLERVRMVAVLSVLGARGRQVVGCFAAYAALLLVRAVVLGLAVGWGLVLLQKYTHLVRLDPERYYVSSVPVELPVGMVLLVGLVSIVLLLLLALVPAWVASRVRPVVVLRTQ